MRLYQFMLLGAQFAFAASVSNAATSLTFLYQNNLNLSDNANHAGALLLDPMSLANAQSACSAINETLITKAALMQHVMDYTPQLSYVEYKGYVASKNQSFWIANGVANYKDGSKTFTYAKTKAYKNSILPVLCTQTQGTASTGGSATSGNEVSVSGIDGNTFVGFRNLKTFVFQGARYAEFPGRFNYSTVYEPSNQVLTATSAGSECYQGESGAEDCFFLNIFSPYIPKSGSTKNLRPVLFFIHGGGYTSGSGAIYDGSDLASREDIVVVAPNYRLGNFGFFVTPGYLDGNYGTGDQITALEWVVANIEAFGGDPQRITIAGQSAGAGSVRTLLGSPLAIGKFQGAIAMSNLGGGNSLGLGRNYGTMYSSIYTIPEAYTGEDLSMVFTEVGCVQLTLAAQVACLRTVNGLLLSAATTSAQAVVIDGTIVNTEHLEVENALPNSNVAHVPVIFGNARNDGASIGCSNSQDCTTESQCLQDNLGISAAYAQDVIDSGLFPLPTADNLADQAFNLSQQIATDITFRCNDQAIAYAAAYTGSFAATYYYQSNRGFAQDAYNPNNVDDTGTTSTQYPNGDPSTPYYVLHSSDIPLLLGEVTTLRAASDLLTLQLTLAYFGSFIKTGNPNPVSAELVARQYTSTITGIKMSGEWKPVTSAKGPMKFLDYPASSGNFVDVDQCSFLNISSSYWLNGGQ